MNLIYLKQSKSLSILVAARETLVSPSRHDRSLSEGEREGEEGRRGERRATNLIDSVVK